MQEVYDKDKLINPLKNIVSKTNKTLILYIIVNMAFIILVVIRIVFGEPGGIRTPDPRLRRPVLYPTELLTHNIKYDSIIFIICQEKISKKTYSNWALLYLKVVNCNI